MSKHEKQWSAKHTELHPNGAMTYSSLEFVQSAEWHQSMSNKPIVQGSMEHKLEIGPNWEGRSWESEKTSDK